MVHIEVLVILTFSDLSVRGAVRIWRVLSLEVLLLILTHGIVELLLVHHVERVLLGRKQIFHFLVQNVHFITESKQVIIVVIVVIQHERQLRHVRFKQGIG